MVPISPKTTPVWGAIGDTNDLELLFSEFLEMSAGESAAKLDALAIETPELQAQLAPLLAAHEHADRFLRDAGESTSEFYGYGFSSYCTPSELSSWLKGDIGLAAMAEAGAIRRQPGEVGLEIS
jgi:hypothetical protein